MLVAILIQESRLWNCTKENTKGKSLAKYLNDQNRRVLVHIPAAPTYFPYDYNRKPSYIDLSFTKNVTIAKAPVSLPITNSDHNPVLIEYLAIIRNKEFRLD